MREREIDGKTTTEILLIKKNPTPKATKLHLANKWNGAGGGLDKSQDKTIFGCIIRELKEELGITPNRKQTRLAGIITYNNNHLSHVEVHCFFCREWQGRIAASSREFSETQWFNVTNLPNDEMPSADKELRLPALLLRTLREGKVISATVTLDTDGQYRCRSEYIYTPS